MCLHNHTFVFLIQLLDIDDDSEVVTINVTESSGLEISSKGMCVYQTVGVFTWWWRGGSLGTSPNALPH